MTARVVLLDYGSGNLRSAERALARAGAEVTVTADYDTAMHLNAFPNGRPAFWRVDELRTPYNTTFTGQYSSSNATTSQYTLWHFSPHISSAWAGYASSRGRA